MAISITDDIAWDVALGDFLEILEKADGTLGQYRARGPGGGNPEITVHFTDQVGADKFAAWFAGRGVFGGVVEA